MERESVDRMHNHRHTREPRRQPSHKSAFDVCVCTIVAFAPQEAGQADQARQIPERTDLPPDDIQVRPRPDRAA